MRGKRVLTWLLALALTVGLMVCPAPKAEAVSDYYKSWSQGDPAWSSKLMGGVASVYQFGCTTVALAKLMVQAGVKDQNTFNPGTLVDFFNASGVYTAPSNHPGPWGEIVFERTKGCVANFEYDERVWLSGSADSKLAVIMNHVKQGHHILVSVEDSKHWVAVDNELTLKNNYVTIMDSGYSIQSGDPWAVNARLDTRYNMSWVNRLEIYKTTCPNHAVSNGKYVEGEGLKCKSCNGLFPVTDHYTLKEPLTAKVTDTGYLRTMPYQAAALNKTVGTGTAVTITGRAKNAYGNLWFKLSDGSWMVGDKLAPEYGARIAVTAGTTIPVCLNVGEAFTLAGHVVSLAENEQKAVNLKAVKIGVKQADNATWTAQVQSRTLDDAAFNIADVDYNIAFNALPAGDYYYCIEATDAAGVTDTLSYPFTIKGHTHSYTTTGVETVHPHREYKKCACGNSYYTGNTVYNDACEVCNPKGPYIVSFHANGGTLEEADSKKLNPGDRYGLLPVPKREGYLFRGWATDAGGTDLVGDLDTFTAEENQVLYAQWNTNIRETLFMENEEGETVKEYTTVAYAVSREQARRICEASGGNLLDVRVEKDDVYLSVACGYPNEELWVGLARDGEDNWVWDTGTALEEELPWGEGEPGEGDAVYYDTTARTFHTGNGETEARYFIYEYGEDEFPEVPPSLKTEVQTSEGGNITLQVNISALDEDGCLFAAQYDASGAFLGICRQELAAYQSRAEVHLPTVEGAANAKVFLTDTDCAPLTEEIPVHVDKTQWSLWQETCDADEDLYEIEERTWYRSRSVETREEEIIFEHDELKDPEDGWVIRKQDMILEWTEGLTTTVKPTEAWDLEITGSRTLYKYQHWHNTYDNTNLNIDSIAYGANCVQCVWSTPTKLTATFPALADMGGKTAYTSDHYCGNSVSRCWWFEDGTETEYTYRTAEFVGVRNHYARYGDWSLWQEEPIAEAEGLEVEAVTEYRWRLRTE